MRRHTLHSALLLVLGLLAGTPAPCSTQPLVFVSIAPQAFFVEQIAGELVRVEVLVPPGASPATYEPTPRQMAALEHADLYLRIGVPFEGPLLQKVATLMPDLEISDCRRGVDLVPMEETAATQGTAHPDPHIWLDPVRAKTIASTTADILGELLPEARPTLDHNLDTLQLELDRVNSRITALLAPYAGREVLVFHPAFGYFTRRYGLRQLAVEAEGKAPSARQLAAFVESLEGSGQKAVFAQPQFSTNAARTVADVLGCEVVELDPLSENYLNNLETMAERIAGVLGG